MSVDEFFQPGDLRSVLNMGLGPEDGMGVCTTDLAIDGTLSPGSWFIVLDPLHGKKLDLHEPYLLILCELGLRIVYAPHGFRYSKLEFEASAV